MTKWACEQSVKMYHIHADFKEDDEHLTPRSDPGNEDSVNLSRTGIEVMNSKQRNVTIFDHY